MFFQSFFWQWVVFFLLPRVVFFNLQGFVCEFFICARGFVCLACKQFFFLKRDLFLVFWKPFCFRFFRKGFVCTVFFFFLQRGFVLFFVNVLFFAMFLVLFASYFLQYLFL